MVNVFQQFSRRRRTAGLILVFVWALCAFAAFAQTSPLAPGQKSATPSTSAPPSDTLGRDTPRGTVIGFIREAQEGSEQAVLYFQPSRRHTTPAEEQELAAQLLAVLNAKFPTSALDTISRDPQPRGDDGQLQTQIRIGGTRGLGEAFPVTLIRVDKLWYISRQQTLDQVPEAYDSLRFPRIAAKLPAFLVKDRPLGMPLWQWLAVVLLAPIALVLGWLLAELARISWGLAQQARGRSRDFTVRRHGLGPAALLIGLIVHYNFVYFIGTSLLYRQYYSRVILVLLAFALYWALTRATDWVARSISLQLAQQGRLTERSLVSLSRRVLDVTIFVLIGFSVLAKFGVDVTAGLAGLGIGGLAIGLGAQKTFENLLGGISILTDKALVVGDPCRIGDQQGVVEDIGLRSTKLRTESRTVVSIPNGTVATAVLENFRLRDKILCRQTVRLRYELSPDHLRYVLGEIRDVLMKHAKVEDATARVRVLRFGENAIDVEIYAYILERDYSEFLATQEDLLLQVMDTLERTGGAVAATSQTTMVTKDAWVDPAKAAAAQRTMSGDRAAADGGKPKT
jgi:MscS family membrane protein